MVVETCQKMANMLKAMFAGLDEKNPMSVRKRKAYELVKNVSVKDQSRSRLILSYRDYEISIHGNGDFNCSCPDHKTRGVFCKHLMAGVLVGRKL